MNLAFVDLPRTISNVDLPEPGQGTKMLRVPFKVSMVVGRICAVLSCDVLVRVT